MIRSVALQRVGPLVDLPSMLAEFNVDVEDVLSGTQIGNQDLVADRFIPFSAALLLLERASVLTGCPHFGLLLGSRHDHTILGLIGQLMSHAPTLRQALLDFVGWQMGNSRGATVYLHRIGSEFALGYGVYDRQSPGGRQLYDLGIAVGCNMVRALSGGRAEPSAVLLSHRPPEDRRLYDDVLKTPLLFDQHQTCIILSGPAMAAANPRANPVERQCILANLEALTRD